MSPGGSVLVSPDSSPAHPPWPPLHKGEKENAAPAKLAQRNPHYCSAMSTANCAQRRLTLPRY